MIQNEKEIMKEIGNVCKKYNLKNIVLGAENEQNKFLGFWGIEDIDRGIDMPRFVELVTNSARLYQAAREKLMNYLDKIAK